MVPVGKAPVVKGGMAPSGTHGRGAERSRPQPQTWSKLEERQVYELPKPIPVEIPAPARLCHLLQQCHQLTIKSSNALAHGDISYSNHHNVNITTNKKRIAIQLKDPIYSSGFWKVSLRKQYLEQKEFTEVGQKNKEDNSLEESTDSKFLRQERELKRRIRATVAEVPGREQSHGWWGYSRQRWD